MQGIYQFFRSTILGGLVVLVPLIVLVAIVGWAIETAYRSIKPFLDLFPERTIGGVSLTLLAVIAGALALCFLVGLCAETALVASLTKKAERLALSVPGYALMKNVGADFVGLKNQKPAKTVLVRFESSWQLGFLMDTLPDGRHVVFIPGVPRALVGSLHFIAPERVEFASISIPAALDILGRLGAGISETWPKPSAVEP
jgi:uncharacterized membrane protein